MYNIPTLTYNRERTRNEIGMETSPIGSLEGGTKAYNDSRSFNSIQKKKRKKEVSKAILTSFFGVIVQM